jgi:peptidoglycan-associated lipoprotein
MRLHRSRVIISVLSLLGIVGLGCSHQKAAAPPPAASPPAQVAAPHPTPPAPTPPPPAAVARGDEAVYFDLDSDSLRDDARPILQGVAEQARSSGSSRVHIEGNCDERGTTEYNLALGAHRAEAAKKYLVTLGVSSARIETVSYGKERPRATGHSEDDWAKNRRDDVVLK